MLSSPNIYIKQGELLSPTFLGVYADELFKRINISRLYGHHKIVSYEAPLESFDFIPQPYFTWQAVPCIMDNNDFKWD